MQDNLDQLRTLLGAGYSLQSIESDAGYVEATFSRFGHSAKVRLHRSDAQRILFGCSLKRTRAAYVRR